MYALVKVPTPEEAGTQDEHGSARLWAAGSRVESTATSR